MIRFNNDYNHGAFASILKELGATNSTSYAGYGEDEWCDKAETIIKKLVDDDDADDHFQGKINGVFRLKPYLCHKLKRIIGC